MAEAVAIILAAGQSRRFGTDKLQALVDCDGRTLPLLACALQPWMQVFARVSVVVRPDQLSLQQIVTDALPACAARVDWVICPQAVDGMGFSLAGGVAASRDACGWVIGLADMPRVPPQAIADVRRAIESGLPMAAPLFRGRRGHPVGFAASYRNALLTLQGDQGARQLVERDTAILHLIETDDPGVQLDIDCPEDFEKLRKNT